MPSLGKVGIADRGTYSSTETYNSGDFVLYGGSTWLCLVDNLTGFEPIEGSENWKYLARGFAAEMLSVITAIDTYGMVGEAGGETDAQTFMDKLADEVANKLVKKTSIVSTHSASTETVPSSALVNELNSNLVNYKMKYVSGVDIHTLTESGHYYCNACTNGPTGTVNGYLTVNAYSSNYVEHTFTVVNGSYVAFEVLQNGAWTGWSTYATTSDLEEFSPTQVVCASVSEIDSTYNNFSSNMSNHTEYRGLIVHQVTHSKIGATGYYLLHGEKTNENFEWQEITSYSSNGTITLTRAKYDGTWSDWIKITTKSDLADYTPIASNAGYHNSIYRGKYLGTSVTDAQWTAISSGTFDNLYVGDYWTINGINWRIMHCNYYYGQGDTAFNTNHLVIVPDTSLYTHVMNDTNITTGGYVGSKMYTEGLESAKTTINTAFSGHVLTHRILFTNAVANGKPSAGTWTDSTVDLMNENMVYGSIIFTPVNDGSTIPYNYRVEKTQLAAFALNPNLISMERSWYWLRDVVSAAYFADVSGYGYANYNYASNAIGVRPAFCIG